MASLALPDSEPLTSIIKRHWGGVKGPGQGCELSCLQDHPRLEGRSHTAAAATDSRAPWRRPFLPISVYMGGDLTPEGIWQCWEKFLLLPAGVGGLLGIWWVEARKQCTGLPCRKESSDSNVNSTGAKKPWLLDPGWGRSCCLLMLY